MKSPPVTITAESKIAIETTAARDVTVEYTQNIGVKNIEIKNTKR